MNERGGYVPEEFRATPEKKEFEEKPRIPENELRFKFSAMGSKGGQNANKVASGAEVHWNIGSSQAFSDEQKESIRSYAREFAPSYITEEDELHARGNEHRDQPSNKKAVTTRIQNLVDTALTPQAERIETRVPRREKEKRLGDKRHQKERKEGRKGGRDGY